MHMRREGWLISSDPIDKYLKLLRKKVSAGSEKVSEHTVLVAKGGMGGDLFNNR